jgi:tetraacyldisaccharide 4'-kinase
MLRRALFGRGIVHRSRFPGRVLSVGSVTRGGDGLAPLAAWVATGLRRRGHKVAIVGRGIRGIRSDEVTVVSDGRFVLSRAEIVGGGAMVLASHAPGIPVLVGPDRALAAWRALSAFGADVLVLEDGFQAHRLARDLDVVAIDASLGLGNRWTFPRGPLRESPSALRSAHAIGVVDGPLSEPDERVVDRNAAAARRFDVRLVAAGLRTLRGGAAESPSVLRGRQVGVLAANAEFEGLRRTLDALGARIVSERRFGNDRRPRERHLRGLGARAPLWVTTEKNAAQILPTWTVGVDVRVLRVGIEVAGAEAILDWIDSRLH